MKVTTHPDVVNHVDIVKDAKGEVTAFCYNGAGAACCDLRHEDGDNYICTWCGEVLPLVFANQF